MATNTRNKERGHPPSFQPLQFPIHFCRARSSAIPSVESAIHSIVCNPVRFAVGVAGCPDPVAREHFAAAAAAVVVVAAAAAAADDDDEAVGRLSVSLTGAEAPGVR